MDKLFVEFEHQCDHSAATGDVQRVVTTDSSVEYVSNRWSCPECYQNWRITMFRHWSEPVASRSHSGRRHKRWQRRQRRQLIRTLTAGQPPIT